MLRPSSARIRPRFSSAASKVARIIGQLAGASVVLGARREERLEAVVAEIRSQGGAAAYRPTDVTRRSDVDALVAEDQAARLAEID